MSYAIPVSFFVHVLGYTQSSQKPFYKYVQDENVAPWPPGVPPGFWIVQTVARFTKNRLPLREILIPR